MNDSISSLLDMPEDIVTRDERTTLMNALFKEAPESPKLVEELKQEGWDEFYSFTLADIHGSPIVGDIQYALKAIEEERPNSIKEDYDIVQAKYADLKEKHPFWFDRVRALMKKPTEKRADWNKQMGYIS